MRNINKSDRTSGVLGGGSPVAKLPELLRRSQTRCPAHSLLICGLSREGPNETGRVANQSEFPAIASHDC